MRLRSAKNLVISFAVFSLTTVILYALKESVAQMPSPGARLYVHPELIEDPTLSPSSTFWTNVTIYNVTDMRVCEFNLSFASEMFDIIGISKLLVQGQYPSAYADVNSEEGYLHVRLTYEQSIDLPETEAQLVAINFHVKEYGITTLDLHDTALENSTGAPIPHEAQDGEVRIIKHDLAVIGTSTSTNETYVGRVVDIEIIFKNEGNVAENFTISVFANGGLIATFDVESLNANETRTIMLDWNTTDIAPSITPYTIKAEASLIPYETDTDNNVYIDGQIKIKMLGDINGDGIVDINDLNIWDTAFNSTRNDTNWNPQADINEDGIVDKEDGIIVVQNYRNEL